MLGRGGKLSVLCSSVFRNWAGRGGTAGAALAAGEGHM